MEELREVRGELWRYIGDMVICRGVIIWKLFICNQVIIVNRNEEPFVYDETI